MLLLVSGKMKFKWKVSIKLLGTLVCSEMSLGTKYFIFLFKFFRSYSSFLPELETCYYLPVVYTSIIITPCSPVGIIIMHCTVLLLLYSISKNTALGNDTIYFQSTYWIWVPFFRNYFSFISMSAIGLPIGRYLHTQQFIFSYSGLKKKNNVSFESNQSDAPNFKGSSIHLQLKEGASEDTFEI